MAAVLCVDPDDEAGVDDIPTDGATQVVDWYFKASTPPAQLATMVDAAVSLRSHTA